VQVQHYLITRFNVIATKNAHSDELNQPLLRASGAPLGERWLQKRIEIFERICLPSVAGQSFDGFTWVLYCDARSPPLLRERAERWKKQLRHRLHVAFVSGELSDKKIVALLGPRLRVPWVATTRLDSDDGLHRDFMDLVHRSARERTEVLNPRHGWICVGTEVFEHSYAVPNMFATLVHPARDMRSVYAVRHTRLSSIAPVRHLDGRRLWLALAHDASLTKAHAAKGRSGIPLAAVAAQFSLPLA
jgi:hypothetical protein